MKKVNRTREMVWDYIIPRTLYVKFFAFVLMAGVIATCFMGSSTIYAGDNGVFDGIRQLGLRLWIPIVIFMGIWLLCDFVADLGWRLNKITTPTKSFVAKTSLLGAINIFLTTVATVFGLVLFDAGLGAILIFAGIMVVTMGLQVSEVSKWSGRPLADCFLNYIQQAIVIGHIVVFILH